jgi:hypothetical protein
LVTAPALSALGQLAVELHHAFMGATHCVGGAAAASSYALSEMSPGMVPEKDNCVPQAGSATQHRAPVVQATEHAVHASSVAQ